MTRATTRLGKVADIVMGQSPPGHTYNESGTGLPFYQGVVDFGHRYPGRRVYCTAPSRVAHAGDILFSVRAPIGRVNAAVEESSFGRGIAAIRPRREKDRPYIEYLLRAMGDRWTALEGGGSVFGNAKRSDLENLEIPWPDQGDRHAVGRILSQLDDKIDLNRWMNETLEAIARAIFKSWFIDFDPVHAKIEGRQPSRVSGEIEARFPQFLEESERGLLPSGWRISSVGEEFDVLMGHSPPGNTYNERGEGIPLYQGKAEFGVRFPTRRLYCTEPKRMAKAGDTLVSVRAPVGAINMAAEACCIGRGLAAVRHRSGSRSYTYYAMLALANKFEAFDAEGTVFGSINKVAFASLICIAPPSGLTRVFEKIASPIDLKIERLESESRVLGELRDTLLPKLISGEIRVRDTERLVGL